MVTVNGVTVNLEDFDDDDSDSCDVSEAFRDDSSDSDHLNTTHNHHNNTGNGSVLVDTTEDGVASEDAGTGNRTDVIENRYSYSDHILQDDFEEHSDLSAILLGPNPVGLENLCNGLTIRDSQSPPVVTKMVRMLKSHVPSGSIQYDTSASLTSDIDSIVLHERFFHNIGMIILNGANRYSFNSVLDRVHPNNSSRFLVSPRSEPDDAFFFTKSSKKVPSVSMSDFPNIKLGEVHIGYGIELKIHFSLLKHNLNTNYLTEHQIATITAALNTARLHWFSIAKYKNLFPNPQEMAEISADFRRSEPFSVGDESKKDRIQKNTISKFSNTAGFCLLAGFEYYLKIMAQGRTRWGHVDFITKCGCPFLKYNPHIESILVSNAKQLYSNRHWYFVHAGTKIEWPSHEPFDLNLFNGDTSLDRAVIESFFSTIVYLSLLF